ncbi:hypothetical protein [Vreelandella nanhaiensis]|uniref:Uncharacterized protein n=1 Tax=Vreelandella nanhaiensis TaxID=1258546 RepID=A0A3S0YDR3_9GAMM|nr:hypothetical protein [Halomonas nanhaiensis]RUR27738.1 hypothetical protein ELY38_18930 [Halomonas nanhaiensis]
MWRLTPWLGGLVGIWLSASTSAFSLSDWPPTFTLDHTLVQISLLTRHFDPQPEHNNHQRLLGIELHNPDHWLAGAARFKNSYEQPTWYVYAGREFPLWQLNEDANVRAKLTGGLLRGYKDEYRDKIPLNHLEVAPALLPSIGVQWERLESDLIIFGTAGMMLTAGLRL